MRPARTGPARRLLQQHRLLRFGPEVPSLERRGSIRERPLPEVANRNSRRTGPAKRTQPQCPENAERMLPRQAPTPPILLSATTPPPPDLDHPTVGWCFASPSTREDFSGRHLVAVR